MEEENMEEENMEIQINEDSPADELTDSNESLELLPIEYSSLKAVLSYEDVNSYSGMILAVIQGDLARMEALVAAGRSPNVNDNHGNTPLHVAAIKGRMEILDFLLKLDEIVINTRNFYGETPLFLAVKSSNLEVVNKLISAGANVNLSTLQDTSPLHEAVKYPIIALTLIENGANLDAVDYSNETPLHEAIALGSLEVVCMLLCHNADANFPCDNNLTPFMRALIQEQIEMQTALINYVDDFNAKTNEGMCILALALTHETPFVPEIIKNGANVNYHLDYSTDWDVLELCLNVPNTEKFRLVWDKYKYKKSEYYESVEEPVESILRKLCQSRLGGVDFFEYLDIIMESENIQEVINSSYLQHDIECLVHSFKSRELPLDYLTKVVSILLVNNYLVTDIDMNAVFEMYGYCQLFKVMLHMDIIIVSSKKSISFPSILYDPSVTVEDLINAMVDCINGNRFENNLLKVFDHFLHPKLTHMYLDYQTSTPYACQIKKYSQIPFLLELSRNATRDYLIKKYNIETSKEYLLLLKRLFLPVKWQEILTFERQLYRID